nr:MAG TPA: transcription factor [Caudoviricetes sp.]
MSRTWRPPHVDISSNSLTTHGFGTSILSSSFNLLGPAQNIL